ncbi:hypothetical protein OC834_006030 [Tilletia horrida]|nr:hypothetical protein OC834_006030 [Tilletia horrida]
MLRSSKALHVQQAMRDVDISFTEFVEEFLDNSSGHFTPILSNWTAYREGRAFGPLRLLQGVCRLLERTAGTTARSAFYTGAIALMEEPLHREMRRAGQIAALSSNALVNNAEACHDNQLDEVKALLSQNFPLATAMCGCLCGIAERNTKEVVEAIDTDNDLDHQEALAAGQATEGVELTASEPKQSFHPSMMLAIALNCRNNKVNRLQAALGLMLRFQRASKQTHTLLNRLGVCTSLDAANRHLSLIQQASVDCAQQLMKDSSRVHVLLFDNLDLYVRVRPGRVATNSHLVNLTTRTLLQLPASFAADAISAQSLAPLNEERALSEAEITGNGAYLRQAGGLFLALELLRAVDSEQSAGRRREKTTALLRTVIEESRDSLRIDELEPEKWDLAPLPLLEVNEGTTTGCLAVLEDTSVMLNVLKDGNDDQGERNDGNDPEADEGDTYLWDGDWANTEDDARSLERTNVLPEGGTLVVVGDLSTHRNVESGLKSRSRHRKREERLDYFRSTFAPWHVHLNYIWAIFRVHFSSDKQGYAASLQRCRDALRRGKAALRQDEPSYNEAWSLIRHVFSGWVKRIFE